MTGARLAVAPPPLDADPEIMVDWLEFVAFFDGYGRARLDSIDDSVAFQQQNDDFDDAAADTAIDVRRELIELEVARRASNLCDAYPFVLSDDGEELSLKQRNQRRGAAFYLSCLITAHLTKSSVLARPPSDPEVIELRNKHFQALATLAVAGHVQGPAISFGHPRSTEETIPQAITRCCETSGTGKARIPPGPEAAEQAKDGGMDVIAWSPAINGSPPPRYICFAQAASGHRWKTKSAKDELDTFLEAYFEFKPACSVTTAIVTPFLTSERELEQHSRRHGHILDRLRAPRAALAAIDLHVDTGAEIDEVRSVFRMGKWLIKYRNEVRAEAA